MLTYLRKHSKSWLAWIVFGSIIVVFVLWGGSSYLSKEASKIAKVDNHIISAEQFSKAYTDQLKIYQDRFGGALTPEMIEKLDLKKSVLDQIIDDYIIEADARGMNIDVTDEDLQYAIQQVPAFKENGKFNMALYQRYLDYERLTPAEFEERQRKTLLKQRFLAVLTENVTIPQQEVTATYHYVKDAFDLSFISIDSAPFVKDIQVTQDQIKAYYDANRNRYKIPPKISIAYIEFPASRYVADTKVAEDEARSYYESHKSQFSTPFKIRARQILIKVPEGADDNVVAAKAEIVKKIAGEASQGKDFASLAMKYSEDEQTAKKGGDMGPITRENVPQGLADMLDSMKPGEIKGPVRSSAGFHILKLESKEGGGAIPFEQVSSTIMDQLKLQRAKIISHDAADKVFTELYEQFKLDLEGYAKKNGLQVNNVGPIAESDDIGIPGSQEMLKKAFIFSAGDLGDVVRTDNGYLIYMVTKKEASRVPELKEVTDRITADIRNAGALDKAKEYALKLSSNREQLLAQNSSSTGPFTRMVSSIPKLAMIPKLMDDLDKLEKPQVYTNDGTVFVVWIKSRQIADIQTMDKKMAESITMELLNQKRQMYMESYLEQARKNHKVIIEKERLAEGHEGPRNVPAPADYN
jgi:peptidyl-prolyl cis-trans isomerase D